MSGTIEEGTYIKFKPAPPKPKTLCWWVTAADNTGLGTIRWYGPWRKYCYFVCDPSMYEWVCLREIAEFCERKTKERKAKRKAATSPSADTGGGKAGR